MHYQKDPVETITTCIQGAINLLNLANENNAIIFQASTSVVYGDPKVHPKKKIIGAMLIQQVIGLVTMRENVVLKLCLTIIVNIIPKIKVC